MKPFFWIAALAICGWLPTLSTVDAQESYDVQKGLTPYGSYKGGDLDSVNMVNGNLSLHIPLISFPQRGKSLRLNYNIYANDKQYMFDYSVSGGEVTGLWWLFGGPCPSGGYIGCDTGATLAHVGAYISADQGNSGVQDLLTTASGNCVLHPPLSPCLNQVNNLYVLGPDDSRHYFGSYAQDQGINYYNCGAAVELSGFVVGPLGSNTTGCSGTITDRDGIVGQTDVDGNYLSSAGDTLGRIITTTTASVSNCAAGTTSAKAWNVPGSSNPYYLCYTSLSYQTAFNALNYSHCFSLNGAQETSGAQLMLTEVVLPNSTHFQFSYDQYLSLTLVTLPTGGSLSYTWQNVVLNCGNQSAPVSRALASRTKNDGVSSVTWHYQWIAQTGGSDPWQHVVTDPLGNDEVHHVNPSAGGTDDEVDSYSGCSPINTQYCSAGTGSPLKIVKNTFQTTGNAAIMSAGEFGMYDVPVPATKTTILAGPGAQTSWKTSKTVYTMVPAAYNRNYYVFSADSGEPPTYPATAPLNTGQIASVAEYDYGTGSPGALLRTTTTTYEWQDPVNGSSYITANLFSLPSKVVVTDVNGYRCSETDYAYDESTYLTTFSGTTFQHGTPPTGSQRGNATTVSRWLSSTPCQSGATGSLTPIHHNVMYDTGEKYQDIDALGNPATYTYSGTYYGGYRTQTQLPTTGTVQHIVSGTYDLNTGLLTQFVGQNGAPETTTYNWDFNMRRILKATFPDGGQTEFCYTDSGTVSPGSTCSQTAPPYQADMQELQKASTWITKAVVFDELGRSTQAQLTSDPSGTDYTDTTYDADGRVATVSNPHRTGSSSTDGITQTQYDGLGRAIFVTKQDGSTTQTEYLDSCNINTNTLATTVTDEAGKVRRSCTDAMGRLTEVDEPGTGATDATPAIGTITISGTEQSNTYNGCPNNGNCPVTIYNSGSVSVSFGGDFTAITGYGQGYTAATVASGLTTQLNVASSPVTATVSGATITLTAKLPGTLGDYTFSSSATYSNALCPTSPCFSAPSFTAPASGALTGGTDPFLGSAPLVTRYFYDGLGNLLCVEQQGGVTGTGCLSNPSNDRTSPWRVRRFTYDSFSRLLTATNPETGTVTYTYDNNGNVLTKTDARGITINYSPSGSLIDALGRVTKKTYSNGDTSVTFSYDASSGCSPTTGNCGIGHRTGMTDASGSTTWTYDTMGRTLSETNIIAGITKTVSTLYNKDGSIQQITYPADSGSILAYTYDAAGHLTTVKDTAHTITYMQSAVYFPPGELNQATFGSVKETSIFNNRLQPCWFYAKTGTALSASTLCTGTASAANVLDMKYNFGLGTGDNGDLLSFTNDKDSNRSVTYGYDSLNRITSATTPNTDCTLVTGTSLTKNWGESFTIDAWGNLTGKTVTKCSAENLSVGPATIQNQLPTGSGFGYDAAGDMTSNGSATYTYNGEGQLKTTAGVTSTYDGDGNRVEKSNGTLYWGTGMLESDGSGNLQREFIFAVGKRIARRDISGGVVYYYFTDDLGSSSVVTNSTGVIQNESDYYPYGGERAYTVTLSNQNYKFTGKERDAESGLDNFGARYDSSTLGRFMTPDWAARPTTVPYAVFGDPQSLNLYGYVRNDPVSGADADGHFGSDEYSSPVTGSELSIGEDINGSVEKEEGQSSDEEWLAQGELLAQNLDSSANAAKSSAQNTGEVSSTKVGGVWLNAYGGTTAERTAELGAVSKDLTQSDRGKAMLSALEARKSGWFGLWGSPKPFDLIQMASGGSYSYAGGQSIMLDRHDIGAGYASRLGGGAYTLERIFAHELGHAAMGNLDNGPGRMNNVNWNENPVMRQLGDFNDRTAY